MASRISEGRFALLEWQEVREKELEKVGIHCYVASL